VAIWWGVCVNEVEPTQHAETSAVASELATGLRAAQDGNESLMRGWIDGFK
jgi:hypothetical protein